MRISSDTAKPRVVYVPCASQLKASSTNLLVYSVHGYLGIFPLFCYLENLWSSSSTLDDSAFEMLLVRFCPQPGYNPIDMRFNVVHFEYEGCHLL